MRSLAALLSLLMFSAAAPAQPKGFRSVQNTAALQQALQQSTASVQSISSDFSQTKHLSLLADKINSKGKFYYQRADKVRIEYTSPFHYLVVMNGGQMLVKDEQKSTQVNTRSSKTMQSVNRIMLDCMRGTVFSNPDFKVTAYENDGSYLLVMSPAHESMRKLFDEIDVYLDRNNYEVQRLNLKEPGGDFTEMNFSNTRHNVALNDALFKLR